MFLNTHKHTIDEKGRMKMPAKYREVLGGQFVVTRGHEKCLYVYTMDEWQKEKAKIDSLPKSDPTARLYSRHFFSGADSVDMDGQGRFLIPQTLREYAGLLKDVVVNGNSSRVEIWDKDEWDKYWNNAGDVGSLDMSKFNI